MNSKLIAYRAQRLPEGPERNGALMAILQLEIEASHAAEQQRQYERVAVKQELRELAQQMQQHLQAQRENDHRGHAQVKKSLDRTMILLWVAIGLLGLKLILR